MDINPALGLASVVLLVLANGFFVATEFAIVAVRRSRLDQLAAEGRRDAQVARDVVQHLDHYIAACQLGITMASLGLGWIGEPALAHFIDKGLRDVMGESAGLAAHGVTVGISFGLITTLHIVIGELAPKGIALQKPEGTTLWVALPLRAFYRLFRWPIGILNAIGNGTLRLFGLRASTGHEMVHSVEELRLLVGASQQAGEVEAAEARIASRAFQFADVTAGELMTPRTEIEAVPIDIPMEDLLAQAPSFRHSRLPVYEESLDQIVGVLVVRDLLGASSDSPGFDLRSKLHPAPTVPFSKPADRLLEAMQKEGWQLAVVVDEYGGTAGIVTLHNLVEALVGRFHPGRGPGAEAPHIGPLEPDGSRLFDGRLRISEFEETAGVLVDEEDRGDADTLGGLIMAVLGRVPRPGDEVPVAGKKIRVERMAGKRVAAARLLPPSKV